MLFVTIQTAAILYAILVALAIVFQICLIAGAPWGRLTQGGRYEGVLPAPGRIAAGVSIPLLLCMSAGIFSAAKMAPNWPNWVVYVVLAVQILSTVLNLITPSRAERLLWGPVTIVMSALAVYVVLGSN